MTTASGQKLIESVFWPTEDGEARYLGGEDAPIAADACDCGLVAMVLAAEFEAVEADTARAEADIRAEVTKRVDEISRNAVAAYRAHQESIENRVFAEADDHATDCEKANGHGCSLRNVLKEREATLLAKDANHE